MSAVPGNIQPAPTTAELAKLMAKCQTTSNGCYGEVRTLRIPTPKPAGGSGHEVRAWDGVSRGSPAEEYLKKARGTLDAVRGDTFHFQQAASVQEAAILQAEGAVIGKVVGVAAKALAPVVKPIAAEITALLEVASARVVAAGRGAAAQTSAAVKKVVSNGLVVLRKPSRVSTKPDTAHFWSGRSKDANGKYQGGAIKAEEIARSEGGKTLEMLIEERKIVMPNWDPTNHSSIKAWQDISAEYAAGASGEIRAVVGNELRRGNIWETRELPALINNPNVTRIIKVDPATGVSVQIYP